MRVTRKVNEILDWHESDPPGVKANPAHVLCTGKPEGTFPGGEAKDLDGVNEEARGFRDGGANGSIIGRNTAPAMVNEIIDIYESGD